MKRTGSPALQPFIVRRGVVVAHDDRSDWGVVVDDAGPAWTPDELTVQPPAEGMVKVQWFDSVDRCALFWEYTAELTTVPTAVRAGVK